MHIIILTHQIHSTNQEILQYYEGTYNIFIGLSVLIRI